MPKLDNFSLNIYTLDGPSINESPYPNYARGSASNAAATSTISGGGISVSTYTITIMGLKFRPKKVVITSDNNSTVLSIYDTRNLAAPSPGGTSYNFCTLIRGDNTTSYSIRVNEHTGNTAPATIVPYVNDSSFRLPINAGSGVNLTWEAWG